jgi:hypothetical protein
MVLGGVDVVDVVVLTRNPLLADSLTCNNLSHLLERLSHLPVSSNTALNTTCPPTQSRHYLSLSPSVRYKAKWCTSGSN